MSIHVKLTPEAKARLAAQRRNSTVTSAIIALLVIVVVGLVLGFFLLPNLAKESPTIVTYQSNQTKEEEPSPEKIKTTVQRKPTAPSSSMARVIAATTVSSVSIPVADEVVDVQSLDFGEGDDFGDGWSEGHGAGKGGGTSFFNQKVSAERIAYVIDYSQSMRGEKDTLMREELTKSVGGLTSGSKFQMIFFSGPAWVAGSEVKGGLVKGANGKTYKWSGKGLHDFTPVGDRQPVDWLDMSARQMKKSLEVIATTKLVSGTDWSNPLEMAFDMDPPPQIVFFMTDGATGGDMMKLTDDLASIAKAKGIIVNCVALLEPKAEEPMLNLAKQTGGVFTIVEAGGKIRQVDRIAKKKK